jgi:hypothetical protein
MARVIQVEKDLSSKPRPRRRPATQESETHPVALLFRWQVSFKWRRTGPLDRNSITLREALPKKSVNGKPDCPCSRPSVWATDRP